MDDGRDLILVHGAWHGAWAWDAVAPMLAAAGHRPIAPELPPRGSDELPATLEEHAEVVRDALRNARSGAVVVAHSYAGLVVQQALSREVETTIEHIVYVDAWLGDDGDSLLDLAPPALARLWREQESGGWLPAPTPQQLGVTEPDQADWLLPRLLPQPWATFTGRLRGASGRHTDRPTASAIVMEPGNGVPFREFATRHDLPVTAMAGGHDVLLTHPNELAKLILDSF
ncbi:MAG TPA: alpha/beta fold hydrolase [Flexivirga sp.]|uniref:lipase family alpha/beta hydrolase n=1 Tax=Flexivirga sp. TaxID=1962927 RepID=UPI002B892B9F|nr:alpha/beta fold hydrolase [Flexivirga sp.]HWC23825.1 alpha/beta fold hydrolase [Flexivirga sp.]